MQPILKYLTEATRQQLSEINLRENDYLRIKLNDKGEDFLIEYQSNTIVDKEKAEFLRSRGRTVSNINGYYYFDTGYAYNSDVFLWFRRVPECFPTVPKDPHCKKWKAAITDFTMLMLSYCWPENKLLFSKEAQLEYDILVKRFNQQSKKAEEHAKYKINKELPAIHPLLLKMENQAPVETKLAPYQLVAAHLSFLADGLALFMDRGTGKTAIAIRKFNAESILHKKGKIGPKARPMKILIICPRQVRLNWLREIEKFSLVPGKTAIVKGVADIRLRLIIENLREQEGMYFSASIYSYDTVPSDLLFLTRINWDLVITDESHRFRNPSSKRWQAIREVIAKGARTLALTGTSICNSFNDLWTQLEFLGPGQSGFKSKSAFKKFYGQYESTGDPDNYHQERLVQMENIPLFQERLTRLSFSISKADAGLNLPDKVYDCWEVDMTPKQQKLYNKLESELVAEFEGLDLTNTVTANHALTQMLRLTQITSGFITWDEVRSKSGTLIKKKRTEQINQNNPKIEAVIEMLRTDIDDNEKVLIWAVYVADIEALEIAITEAGFKCFTYYGATNENDRQFIEDAFNDDPEVRVLILNPRSAAEGLNLLGYNHTAPKEEHLDTYTGLEIFFSQNWSLVDREQAEDRSHRRGTRNTLRIRDLTVQGTIDEEIRDRVTKKIENANAINDLSNILSSVLKMDTSKTVSSPPF